MKNLRFPGGVGGNKKHSSLLLFLGTATALQLGRLLASRMQFRCKSSGGGASVAGVEDPFLSSAIEPRRKSGLYTRTGDKGSSSLYNGERRAKTDAVFDALGHQDELCCILGVAREHCIASRNGLDGYLTEIQSRLFDLGAAVATPIASSSDEKRAYTALDPRLTEQVEEWIDALDATLPPLTNFVIPSGGMSCTHLNLARAVCRRAERAVIPLVQGQQADAEVGRYLNRLADFLFAASRAAALRENKKEILWRKKRDI